MLNFYLLFTRKNKESNLFWQAMFSLAVFFSPVDESAYADEQSRYFVQKLIIEKSNLTKNVDPSLGLGLARVLSNFDADAIGPEQRIGVFQLNPSEFKRKFDKINLLNPETNIEIALTKLDKLIEKNNGEIHLALLRFNGSQNLGPWPNLRVVDFPAGFVANVYHAQSVFSNSKSGLKPNQKIIVKSKSSSINRGVYKFLIDHPHLDAPRWRRKLEETNYWLSQILETKELLFNEMDRRVY